MKKRSDDYKPLNFYKKNAPKIQNGASRFSQDGEHWFAWFENGEIELISEGYTAKAGRDNGIKSLIKNMKLPGRYKFFKAASGKHYYDVLAGNGQSVASSVYKTSEKAARAAASALSGAILAAASPVAPVKTAKPAKAKSKPAKAKAAPKARAKSNEDDYRPLAFYTKQTKGTPGGIEKFKGDDGEFYFTYNENGKIAMISEGYPTIAARDTGAASVLKNRTLEKRYTYHRMKNGKHEFRLKAGNGREIARSVWFGSAAAAATGAAYVMGTRKRSAAKPKTKAKTKRTVKKAAPVAAAATAAMAGAAAARPKQRKDDDYLRCKEYHDRPVTDAANNIAVFTHENGFHYFAVYDSDGDVRLRSEGFPNKAARQSELNAVLRNIDNKERYKKVTNGEYTMDVLYDEDEREIGRSCLGKIAPAVVAPAAVAPVAVAAAAPAAAATGGGGFGWLKWLIPLLLLLALGLFGLSKCNDGKAALAAKQAQAAKVAADAKAATEAKAAAAAKKAAEMKAAAEAKAAAAARAAKIKADKAAAAAAAVVETPKVMAKPAMRPVSGALNACGSSDISIFNVPTFETPVAVSRLGTYPEFGDSHGLSPAQFFAKLESKYYGLEQDRQYLDYLFKSMGYAGGFKDADASVVSDVSLPYGTAGLLGLGVQHHFDYNQLNVTDKRDLEAFRLESKNGQVVHFMKTCGNYFYGCQ